jgi:phage terminase small subunit
MSGKDLTVDALSPEQAAFALHYVEHGDALAAYRHAYNAAPDRSPGALRVRAHAVLHTPKVANRVRELNASAIAQAARLGPTDLVARLEDIIEADPNELVSRRLVNCRHCHGKGFGFTWKSATELARAMDRYLKSLDTPKPLTMPDASGGFGFDPWADPHPECPHCEGEGVERIVTADTTKLSRQARALFQGVDANGRILMASKTEAADALARIHAMYVTRTESRSVSLHVEPLKDMTPDQVLEFMTRQKLLT